MGRWVKPFYPILFAAGCVLMVWWIIGHSFNWLGNFAPAEATWIDGAVVGAIWTAIISLAFVLVTGYVASMGHTTQEAPPKELGKTSDTVVMAMFEHLAGRHTSGYPPVVDGRGAYERYCAEAGETRDGQPLPSWTDLGDRQRAAWKAAAGAV